MNTKALAAKFAPLLIVAIVAVVAAVYALVALSNPASAQSSPSVAISLSPSGSVAQGTAITATLSFSNLEYDSDTSTTDYAFRADVTFASECEGGGIGLNRYMYKVDEDPETRSGTVSADCPPGDYTIRATISTPQSVALAAAMASFTVVVPAQEPTPEPTPEPTASPTSSIALSPSDAVEQGTAIAATMSFGDLASDSDTSTTDYVFRADVVDADGCEGGGIGFDRYMYKVDEDPETRSGTVSADCPAGAYTLRVSISSADNTELASASAGFFILRAPVVIEPPTLSALSVSHGDPAVAVTLSPAFDSGILEYSADVRAAQVTIAPTASNAGATVAYLDGNGGAIADADATADGHQVDLDAGSNTVSVAVGRDGLTTTYTVNLFRLATQQQTQTDATLSALTLSHGTLSPAFSPAAYFYTVRVANGVSRITISGTTAGSGVVAYQDASGRRLPDADGGAAGQQVNLPAVGGKHVKVVVTEGADTHTYDVLVLREGTVATDRAALMALYNNAGGSSWDGSANWGTAMSLEDWYGVTTDANGRVTRLLLITNDVNGRLPADLGNLDKLTYLKLQSQHLTGEIPASLGNLTNLTNLELFSGPISITPSPERSNLTGRIPDLRRLTNLRVLNLSRNRLTGELPEWLGDLRSLIELKLQFNRLEGNIPASLGSLSSLRSLHLRFNQLEGKIPASLGSSSSLQVLDLRGNRLTGNVPAGLGSSSNLNSIYLGENQLNGEIPSSLGSLSVLQTLGLGKNRLTGEIPASLGSLSVLQTLGLGGNQLEGQIPASLGSLGKLRSLLLENNQLAGPIPASLGSLAKLTKLSLHGNQLEGVIPSELRNLSHQLEVLTLGDNNLDGTIPDWLGTFLKLKQLDLDGNGFTGEIPASLGNLRGLGFLDLGRNRLTGPIPTELGKLTGLGGVRFSGNSLTGCVPAGLKYLATAPDFAPGIPAQDFAAAGLQFCADLALSDLTASQGRLLPAFNSAKEKYRVWVRDEAVTQVTLTWTTRDPQASHSVSPADADGNAANGYQVAVIGGSGVTVSITVIAPEGEVASDGTTRNTYTVRVSREQPPTIVIAASKNLKDRRGGPDNGGYRERDLIIDFYNLEPDATWETGYEYSGDYSTLDYVFRTDIRDRGRARSPTGALFERNPCEGPEMFQEDVPGRPVHPHYIRMSDDREFRRVNENPESRDGGVMEFEEHLSVCANGFGVVVTVWEGADYELSGRQAQPVTKLECFFRYHELDAEFGEYGFEFFELPLDGSQTGPAWRYQGYVVCSDRNSDFRSDSERMTAANPILNWEPPEEDS